MSGKTAFRACTPVSAEPKLALLPPSITASVRSRRGIVAKASHR